MKKFIKLGIIILALSSFAGCDVLSAMDNDPIRPNNGLPTRSDGLPCGVTRPCY